ncbi:amidohydrolase [Kytococcus sedentarius]|uniref:amidohydrolase n=1 Tax=Kytococcus sedentarius TaxID=1276 RepID=UPI0035BBABA1
MQPIVLRNVTTWNPDLLPEPDQTIVLRAGRVAWVGPTDQAPDTSGLRHPRTIEGEGRLVTPAFVDAHAHVSATGEVLGGADLSGTRSVAEALDRVAAAAARQPGAPIFAHSWDETHWVENRALTAAELDRASGGGVVYAPRVDLHAACVSSSLAAVAGVATKDGWDGVGTATRAAQDAVVQAWAASVGPGARRRNIDLALAAAARAGVGMVHEMGATNLTSQEDVRDVALAGGQGRPRTAAYWGELVDDPVRAANLRDALGVVGLGGDIYLDGSIGARNAGMLEPYTDAPDTTGDMYLTLEEVTEHLVACTLAGVQGGFHAIGDAAIELAAEGLEQAAQRLGADAVRAAQHRIEHAELPSRRAMTTFARLGVTCSMQPMFEGLWGGPQDLYRMRLGERWQRTNPWRTLDELGVPVCFGSDSPVTPWDPWGALRACVRPQNPGGLLPATRALSLHTTSGWGALGRQGGSIRRGGEADVVLWDTTVDGSSPRALDDWVAGWEPPQALVTVVDGHVAHDAGIPPM